VLPAAVEVAAILARRPVDQVVRVAAMVDQVVLLLLTEIPQQLVQAKEIMVVQVALVAVAIKEQVGEAALVLWVEIVVVVPLVQAAPDQSG
jgi:hypothetical protein